MLYHLFDILYRHYDFPGARLFQFLSFRAALALIIALLITVVFGNKLIQRLHNLQVKETIRELGLKGEEKKRGTPTMGGLIILGAILVPTLLLTKLNNIYIIIMLVVTVWMGTIGFIDDYIKVFKQDKKGLRGQFKILGQVGLGLILGVVMYFSPQVTIRTDITNAPNKATWCKDNYPYAPHCQVKQQNIEGNMRTFALYNAPVTNVPFWKNLSFNYAEILAFFNPKAAWWGFLIYIFAVIFIVTAVSNAANLTDGIDGLAAGLSGISGVCMILFAYISGNVILSSYLNVLYLPEIGELVIFAAAFTGACFGFLWYNAHPAQVFMGDTGSLTLGSIIAALAIITRKELLIPLLCGIFFIESLSVILQVWYFKRTKKKFGQGRRIFLMSPLHHHYQVKGIHESKIVMRFFLVGILLAALTFVTFKIR